MTTPKMKTDAPLSAEQIRAILNASRRRRRYIRIRSIVRFVFWTAVILLVLSFIDDYGNTCEALGQVCGR